MENPFSSSNDVSLASEAFNGTFVRVNRPADGEMYSIFFCSESGGREQGEEIAMISGSTEEARKVYAKAVELLRSAKKPEEVKEAIRRYIVDIHGGMA